MRPELRSEVLARLASGMAALEDTAHDAAALLPPPSLAEAQALLLSWHDRFSALVDEVAQAWIETGEWPPMTAQVGYLVSVRLAWTRLVATLDSGQPEKETMTAERFLSVMLVTIWQDRAQAHRWILRQYEEWRGNRP